MKKPYIYIITSDIPIFNVDGGPFKGFNIVGCATRKYLAKQIYECNKTYFKMQIWRGRDGEENFIEMKAEDL
jgi:hypothetical protein